MDEAGSGDGKPSFILHSEMNTPKDPKSDKLSDRIFRVVRDDVLDAGEDFTKSTPLLEAGLDSLSLTELLLSIEEETGVWIDEEHITPENFQDVSTLVECVRDLRKQENNADEGE